MSSPVWRNWGRCEQATPSSVERPRSEDEVTQALRRAAEQGRRVKVVGASHSFSGIAVPQDVLMDVGALAGITHIDVATGEVTLRGGTPLHGLADALEPYGLALPNMGDIDRQTIAGALSTGTHGTGLAFTGYSGLVRRMRLALADGTVVTLSPTQDPELFQAARVGLGALGVILEVTLACVPSFTVSAAEHPAPVQETAQDFVEACRRHDHVEFYWFPHTELASVKVNTRLPADAPRRPLSRRQVLVEDELLGNTAHRLLCEVGRAAPRLIPPLNRIAARAMGDRDYADRSDRIFVSPRRTRFREMEYAVPLTDFPEVFAEVRRAVDGFGEGITFPLEVRCAAADDTWLGTASGRQSAYIAVHRFLKEDHRRYFAAVEPILAAAGGRPHWGKIHTLGAEELAARYPHFEDFVAVRDRVDPAGMFANAYLDRVLGTVGG